MGGMGQGGQLDRDQRRQAMHTTQQQDRKYASCAEAMNKVRGGIRHMSRPAPAGQTPDAQQADDGSGQFEDAVQNLEQDQNDFLDSLNDGQKTALESQIKDVQKKMRQLDTWSKELKAELDDKSPDPAKIREQVRKMDKLSKDI